jgi:energy-converting hydrogenase B subunit D
VTVTLQIVVLSVVMLLGVAVVFARDPLRQTVVNGIFGLALVVLFVVLQAPDVGISELVVATIAFPLVLLAAIYQTRDESEK